MKLLSNLKVKPKYTNEDIFEAIKKKYHIFHDEILDFEIVKESIDAREKPRVFFSLNVAVGVKKTAFFKVQKLPDVVVDHSGLSYDEIDFHGERPVVVGFGPAGMFAGLALAKMGLKPIILEQGKSVDERQIDVDDFWKNGKLNEYSNVQFGEGGAGTFSDGKLASNVSNEYTKKVINEFVLSGAPKDIFFSGTPHLGSDKLKEIVKNIREKILEFGGEVRFCVSLESFEKFEDGKLLLHVKNTKSGEISDILCSALILAVGHSAEKVFKFLDKNQCKIEPKPFALGVRIEQSQEVVNVSQYGNDNADLPPANYKLVTHLENGRSVFTFCMCPGGVVVGSSSEKGTVITNGMSNRARDGKNANSALLVNVTPQDFENGDALAGLSFQKKYEKLAFEIAGKNYFAPVMRVDDFLKGEVKNLKKFDGKVDCDEYFGRVIPSYLPGVKPCNLKDCLPDFVYESLRLAIPKLNLKMKNFAQDDDLLIGVETRSSSAVKIVRDENFMTNLMGVFVCGEGSGYAGGITSSAADGIKCAEKVAIFLKNKDE